MPCTQKLYYVLFALFFNSADKEIINELFSISINKFNGLKGIGRLAFFI